MRFCYVAIAALLTAFGASAQSGAGCAPSVVSQPILGAELIVRVTDGCRSGEVVALVHQGVSFSKKLDREGRADFLIPVLEPEADAKVQFADGAALSFEINHAPGQLRQVFRVALIWDDPVSLSLNVLEFAAEWGSDGHVGPLNQRNLEAVAETGGGYLRSFRPAAAGYPSVEVYTFWAAPGSETGVVQVAVDYASRGSVAEPPYCGDVPLAAPRYRLIRSAQGEVETRQTRRIARAPCGLSLDPSIRFATRPTDDMKITSTE